jgi:hypothetical protein
MIQYTKIFVSVLLSVIARRSFFRRKKDDEAIPLKIGRMQRAANPRGIASSG